MRTKILSLLLLPMMVTIGKAQGVSTVYNRLTNQFSSYPFVTIRQIQEVPLDSLHLADSLQNSQPDRAYLQHSTYNGDTVIVVGLCAVPWDWYRYTQSGFTMTLYDTADNPFPWGGIFVRCSTDTGQHTIDGFKNIQMDDVIKMTGVVSEYPLGSMNGATQFQPIPGVVIEIIGSKLIPLPPIVGTSVFQKGTQPSGKVQYSTGEQYEGIFVDLRNLTVTSILNSATGTFSMTDVLNNEISDYDASKWFTLRSYKDPNSYYTNPSVGTFIDRITGMITVIGGVENFRGYRLCPTFPEHDPGWYRPNPLNPPQGASIGNNVVSFRWQKIQPSATSYWFELATDSSFASPYVDSLIADTSVTVTLTSGNGIYWWRVRGGGDLIWGFSWGPFSEIRSFNLNISSVDELLLLPKKYELEQAYPTPFNPRTTIRYKLPVESKIVLKIYNLLGEVVAVLKDGEQQAGYESVVWNASNVASGVYFYRIEAIRVDNPLKTFTQVRKVLLLK